MQEALPDRPWTGSTTKTITTGSRPMGLAPLEPGSSPAGVDSAENNGSSSSSTSGTNSSSGVEVQKIVSENAVLVFGRRGCCMSHVVQRLLLGLGANPPVFEVDDDVEEALLIGELRKIVGARDAGFEFPVVFVGGEMFGGLERVMATHISGELVPILRQAGALWL